MIAVTLMKLNSHPRKVLPFGQLPFNPAFPILLNRMKWRAEKDVNLADLPLRMIQLGHGTEVVRQFDDGEELLHVQIQCGALLRARDVENALNGLGLRKAAQTGDE